METIQNVPIVLSDNFHTCTKLLRCYNKLLYHYLEQHTYTDGYTVYKYICISTNIYVKVRVYINI